MAIYKASARTLKKAGLHYTALPSPVLKSIRSMEALSIWAYLNSQDEGWIVRTKDIQNHFGVGRDKVRKAINHLKELGLVWHVSVKNEKGQIIDNQIVCSGIPKNHLDALKALETLGSTRPPENPTLGQAAHTADSLPDSLKNRRSEKPTAGKSGPLIKDQLSNKGSNKALIVPNELGPGEGQPSVNAPDKAKSKKPKRNAYPDEFEFLWAEKPERQGSNSKANAFKACKARIKDGATWRELLIGMRKYKHHQQAIGKLNTEFTLMLSTFFGPGEHWKEEWAVNHETGTQHHQSGSTAFNRGMQSLTNAANKLMDSQGGHLPDPADVPHSLASVSIEDGRSVHC